jgi:LysR family nitrogen assimilation transcriptional regulator
MADSLSTRQLRTFLQVAELRSLTRAAAVLHVSQPALSRQIQALEESLGVVLFNRLDRGVTLTEEGELLRDRAAEILRDMDRLGESIAARASEPAGTVHVGLPPSMHDLVTLPLLATVRARHPKIVVHLTVGISVTLNEALQAGKLDCAVVSDIEPLVAADAEPLLRESLFLIGPPAAKLAPTKAVPLEALSGRPLLLTPRPNSLRLIVEDALAKRRIPFELAIESNSTQVLLDSVNAGVGFTVLPYCAVHRALAEKRVSAAPVSGLAVTWVLIQPRARRLGAAGRRLREALVERIGDAVRAKVWRSGVLG